MSTPAAAPSRVLQAVTQAALDVTGAAEGWLLAVAGDSLRVVAAAGGGSSRIVGAELPADVGTAGFVAASARPLALSAGVDDPRLGEGVPSLLGRRPCCVLAVPCLDEGELTGVLEFVDKPGGAFSFDDVEMATLLAGVAGVALVATERVVPVVPGPEDLAVSLQYLATADPARFAVVASLVGVFLARE